MSYFSYIVTYIPSKNAKQKSKNFTYATLDSLTGVYTYDADLEFLAFRCALHFRHLVTMYKKNGIDYNIKDYPKLRCWYAHKPEWLFT